MRLMTKDCAVTVSASTLFVVDLWWIAKDILRKGISRMSNFTSSLSREFFTSDGRT